MNESEEGHLGCIEGCPVGSPGVATTRIGLNDAKRPNKMTRKIITNGNESQSVRFK